jgi:hypothetical protein
VRLAASWHTAPVAAGAGSALARRVSIELGCPATAHGAYLVRRLGEMAVQPGAVVGSIAAQLAMDRRFVPAQTLGDHSVRDLGVA